MTSAPTPDIRAISARDLEELSLVFVACFTAPPWNEPWTTSAARTRLADMVNTPNCRGVVAVRDAKIIGMAFGQIEGWVTNRLFLLQEFCVMPSSQNQGLGKALLNTLFAKLAVEDVGAVYLLTNRQSLAQAFYEKFGFAVSAKKLVMSAAMPALVERVAGAQS